MDLFESDSRLGGHTHTHTLELEEKIQVDSGFIVLNNRNYALLTKLFSDLNVELHPTPMSFGVETDSFGWCSDDFLKFRFFNNLKKVKLLFEIIRFNKLASNVKSSANINDWLNQNNFSNFFKQNYILPMSASIWSCSEDSICEFPMRSLSRFFYNHGLLNLIKRPQWYSVIGGSNTYVQKLIKKSKINNIFTDSHTSIKRDRSKVEVSNKGRCICYDRIIFACHANQIKDCLIDITQEEQEIFGMFDYTKNKVLLHCDPELMPRNRTRWSSWNSFKNRDYDFVTYWMNNLQKLNTKKNIFVTLGKFPKIDKRHVYKKIIYEHPLFSDATLMGQKRIKAIQGKNNTYFSGAHLGYGFHEDGIKSSIEVVRMIDE